jgi:uncharacterized membrane protein YoaK (UPF0700 family)
VIPLPYWRPLAIACNQGGMIKESAFLIGRQSPDEAPRTAVRLRDGLVVVLALTTGAVDAVSYLRLGRVFSSIITGDLALLGISPGTGSTGQAVNAGLALAGYGLGVLAGGALARTPQKGQPLWPRRATATLAVELLMLAGFSGGWLSTDGHPSGGPRLVLLAVAAAAMGVQSVAVRRLGPMSTTYLSSTLIGVLQALAIRHWPSQWQRSTGVLLAFVIGALLGGLAVLRAPAALPAAVLVPLAAVVTCSLPGAARRGPGG